MDMKAIKKIWRFLSSMRFAILLLVVLAVACSVGSLVTQGQTYDWYAQHYSERTAALIVALRLDDAFHSIWFIVITGFLCLNLVLCNLTRLPQLIRRTRAEGQPEGALKGEGDVSREGIADPASVFARLRMPKPAPCQTGDGREALFASKHRAGLWGAWVCHLGILLLILGFGLGQMTQKEYAVYGVPGDVKPIGDTGWMLKIDDFTIGLRQDATVEQYTAAISVYSPDGGTAARESAEISVNHPATIHGMKFYQNSTGWAGKVNVLKDGEPLQAEVVCAGDFLPILDKPELVVYLNAFYPDYVLTPGVGPSTASANLNNPAWLYSVYYQGSLLGMNALMAGEALTIDEYTVTFTDPQNFTLIQIKRDRFTWLALLGGLITTLGLLLAFYVQPAKVWAVRDPDGTWTVHGQCKKGGAIFRERFEKATNQDTQTGID